jgi:hypothetical protein
MAKRIEEIDRNFVAATVAGRDLRFIDAKTPPFELSGLAWWGESQTYCRLPIARLPQTNEGVQCLAYHTAGVQIRFRTHSRAIAVRYVTRGGEIMPHMPATGSHGMDLYRGVGAAKVCVGGTRTNAPTAQCRQVQALLIADDARTGTDDYTLNFPLYEGVEEVQIGLDADATLASPTPFAVPTPVAFYGSSITQGGCASRPGNAYVQMISRMLDCNVLNFGFSGSCRAEPVMAELFSQLTFSAFVYDYDHNAPTAQYLDETHEPFYRWMRASFPTLPIIFVAKPNFDPHCPDDVHRSHIVRRTFDRAVASGDRRVYHIDNATLFGEAHRDACTVDGCHPNDLGFYRMAVAIAPTVRRALIDAGYTPADEGII